MRRIKSDRCQVTPSNHLYDGKTHRVISERDYRLIRAVVKAADKHRDKLIAICNHGIGGPYAEVVRAIDAFNMPKGRK